jgi:hypothetical protein
MNSFIIDGFALRIETASFFIFHKKDIVDSLFKRTKKYLEVKKRFLNRSFISNFGMKNKVKPSQINARVYIFKFYEISQSPKKAHF